MEIEQDWSSENLTETIIINSDNYPILNDINLETEQNLRIFLDMKNNIIRKNNQLYYANLMGALHKAETIEMNVGMRFERKEQNNKQDQGDWVHFIKGIGQSTKSFKISFGDYILNSSNLDQFGQELLRLNHFETFHLEIGKEKELGVIGFTKLGEALRRMTQLQDLSITIRDNCSLEVNGAYQLFYGMETCEKIRKLKVHIGSNNCLTAEGTQIISAAVGQLKQISDFDLFIGNTNDIRNRGMQLIADSLLKQHLSKSAEKLSLKIDDMKGIEKESIVNMFSSIERFTKLKDLSVDFKVMMKMNSNSIKIIKGSLKKLTSLLKISLSINGYPCDLNAAPMVDLLTRFQFSDNLMSLQVVIPPQNEFNNYNLSLFAVNLKKLEQLRVFSLEIQQGNLQGNTNLQITELEDDKNMKMNQETTNQQEPRGISDISESLSRLKKLEKVEWIISDHNDVSDGGWEMLSRSQSLRDFRVKIGEQCRLQDKGLYSLSNISSSISLECLIIEVLDQNNTSQGSWSNLLSSVDFQKMKEFKIFVGKFNECNRSLSSLAKSFEKSSPFIEYLTLDFKKFYNINLDSIQQLAESLKSMVNLKKLVFRMPSDQVITSSALKSFSESLERMSEVKDLSIFLSIEDDVELLDEIKLCSAICSLRKLQDFNLHIEGNGSFRGSSIISKVKSQQIPLFQNEKQAIFEFRTENGLQFQKKLTKQYACQKEVDNLADILAFMGLVSQYIVYLRIQINPMRQGENCTSFSSFLSRFKKCTQLKLEISSQFFCKVSLIQLAESIACMPLLSKLSLRLDYSIFPLQAAETLAAFFENSPRNTKVQLIWNFNPDIDQSQVQFHLMSFILTCTNLKQFQVFFECRSQIKFEFKNQPKIEDRPLVSQMYGKREKILVVTAGDGNELVKKTNKNVPLEESGFKFMMEDTREPTTNESLIYLGKFFMSRKLLQIIKLEVSSDLYVSTEIAIKIQEGIKNQANLTDLRLEFTEKCVVSGEGAVLLSQSFVKQKNKRYFSIKIQTDDTFSIDYALTILVSTQDYQNYQMNMNYLEITGTKFILTTNNFLQSRTLILYIDDIKKIAFFQGKRFDLSEVFHLSQIADKLSKLNGISDLIFNVSNFSIKNQDWSLFQQLSSLTHVSIKDKSPVTSSRFQSLESSLSQMTHLKYLTLNLSHIPENATSEETIIAPFGKYLNNLKEITKFTITLQDFNFGQDGGKALGQGIEGMIDLEYLEIKCFNPQNLLTEGIKYLCEAISKSSKIYQLNLYFSGLDSSLDIPFFSQLKNHLWDQLNSLKQYSIYVKGDITQELEQNEPFSRQTHHIKLNRGINHIYELLLPSKYCFKSAFENEAISKCTDILQAFYSSSNETQSIENVTVNFDFQSPQFIEPKLIFLKTLFTVLQQEQKRVKLLTIRINSNQKGQFQFFFENALKDIKLVDKLYLDLDNSNKFQYSIQELYLITNLDTLINLKIMIRRYQENLKQIRQRIGKMKRLCQYEFIPSNF